MAQLAKLFRHTALGGLRALERFGKFQLLELIDRGGMAEIYLAKPADAALSKLVALKRILPELSKDPSILEMFLREGEIALKFRHHSIIAVHEMGEISQRCYLSMEYFPGKTLANIANRLYEIKGRLEPGLIALIIMRVAEALNYIHDFRDYGGLREFIHRDISPHNIMVGIDGATKLIDFGIAKDTNHEITKNKMLKGKIAYMSPEQLRGDPVTKRSDIFSLGIVFWEMLAGKKLFTGKSIKDVQDKVLECHVPSLMSVSGEVPQELARICGLALQERAGSRYASAGEMAADLAQYLKLFSGIENPQNLLSQGIQELFPDDINYLKNRLRQYETRDESSPQASMVRSQKVGEGTGSLAKSNPASRRREPSILPQTLFLCAMIGAVIGLAIKWASIKKLSSNLSNPPTRCFRRGPLQHMTEICVPVANVVSPLPPVASSPPPPASSAPATSPSLAVVPTPTPSHPTIPSPTVDHPSVTQPVTSPVTNPPDKVADEPLKSIPEKAVIPLHPKIVDVGQDSKRSPASKPAMQNFAKLTIIADPDSRIVVNGKFVGKEIVNEMRVPSDITVTVKAISDKTGATKKRSFHFKPFSRNVVELNDSSD